jgi:hypothetical protein
MSTPQHTLSPAPPWHITVGIRWISVRQAAEEWRRSRRTIQMWCENGTLIAAGNRVYKDFTGRLWIGVPAQDAHPPA